MLAIERGFIRIRIKPKHTTRYLIDKPFHVSAAWAIKKAIPRDRFFAYSFYREAALGMTTFACCSVPIALSAGGR
jgi:hypothetical protein